MASILRSSKFVRYIAGFARHVVVNTPREFDGNFVNTTQCFCNILPRSLTTQPSAQHDLERSLRRLDQDVRKSGRISRRDIEDVLEEIRSSRSATSSQSLLVIRCCGNLVPEEMPEIRTKMVQEIWNTLIKLNVPMDISHYNALLRVYLENEYTFSPTDFLAQLEEKGIEPNRVTYQRLISRYCQLGDIEGATKILEFMREKQLPVNENVFNALIMGHSQSGDMKSAEGILAVMSRASLEPSADSYTTLLCGYAKVGEIETISKLLEECENKEIYLLDKDLLDVVYSLAINGHNQHVPVVLSKVRKAIGYNQDAINVIYRLINKSQEEAAYLVLKTMIRNTRQDGTMQQSGAFFIKQMIKANRPLDKILEICNRIKEDNLYNGALILATEASLELGNENLAYPLMKELQKTGQEIRQHFFWPLILSKKNDPTGNGIIEVLLQMSNFNITPNSETIRDYVIPNIKGNSRDIISKLRQVNISVGSAACNLVYNLLQKHNIEEAAIIMGNVEAYYYPELIKRPLTMAFYKTNNLNCYMNILRYVYENFDRRETVLVDLEEDKSISKDEVIGQFIWDLAYHWRSFLEVGENVLKALVKQGLSIDSKVAQKLEDKYGEKLTPEISSLLGKLTSGELTPTPLVKKSPMYTPADQMNIPQLERLIANLTAKGQDTLGLKRQLLSLYCRAKELVKVEELLRDLEGTEFKYTAGVYAQLIDVYSYNEKLDEALHYYNKLKEIDPDSGLDDLKVIRVVGLLIKSGRFEEGINFLNTQARERKVEDKQFQYTAQSWRLLNSLAELGKEEELDVVFDTLIKNEYIEPTNVMLGPLVKVHLVKGDITKALEKFEWCCNQYRATPWKNELICKLIQIEDAEKLQKLTDLSTVIHGEVNSLYDLVFAFVECGRIRQARKILETPGLQTRPQRINNACQRYQMEGMVKQLEGLKDATKDLNHINRTDIYYQLLLSYIKQVDIDKALGLWTQMQEEDIAPTDQFLFELGNFLKENGVTVPFNIPSESPKMNEENIILSSSRTSRSTLDQTNLQAFRREVKASRLDSALEIKKKLKLPLSISDTSNLIELMIHSDHLNDAIKLTMELLNRGLTPIPRVFRYLLNKLAAAGDIQTISTIGTKINTETKKMVSYDNRVCHAHVIAGKASEYIAQLSKEIDSAKDEEMVTLAEKFPRGGVLAILEKEPELVELYENIAFKYAKRGIISPINVLWTYYFTEGKPEKAEEIWKHYLQNSNRVMFQRVVQKAREKCDDNMAKSLIQYLKTSIVTRGAIGNAYSCLLDILVLQGKMEESISTFEDALKDVPIDFINRTALLRIKEFYDKVNRPFNYEIPSKSSSRINANHLDDDERNLQ